MLLLRVAPGLLLALGPLLTEAQEDVNVPEFPEVEDTHITGVRVESCSG